MDDLGASSTVLDPRAFGGRSSGVVAADKDLPVDSLGDPLGCRGDWRGVAVDLGLALGGSLGDTLGDTLVSKGRAMLLRGALLLRGVVLLRGVAAELLGRRALGWPPLLDEIFGMSKSAADFGGAAEGAAAAGPGVDLVPNGLLLEALVRALRGVVDLELVALRGVRTLAAFMISPKH